MAHLDINEEQFFTIEVVTAVPQFCIDALLELRQLSVGGTGKPSSDIKLWIGIRSCCILWKFSYILVSVEQKKQSAIYVVEIYW